MIDAALGQVCVRVIIDRGATHLAALGNVITAAAVHGAAVVPDHGVTRLPRMCVHVVLPGGMLQQILQEHAALCSGPPNDLPGMRAHEQQLAT